MNVYDTTMMFAHIMKERGVTNKPDDLAKDREKIMKGLTEIKDFPGLATKISFNPKTGDADKRIYVVKAQGGEWVLVD